MIVCFDCFLCLSLVFLVFVKYINCFCKFIFLVGVWFGIEGIMVLFGFFFLVCVSWFCVCCSCFFVCIVVNVGDIVGIEIGGVWIWGVIVGV